jgi:hypothetical protein
MIFGFNPLGSAPIGAYVPHGMVPVVQSIRYAVGPHGWALGYPHGWLDAGTIIDTMQPRWFDFLTIPPPIDAVPLNQYTYDWFVSAHGRVGQGYPYWTTAEVPGVVGLGQSWLRKFEQGGKWSFCLTAGTLWPANQERP